MRRGAESRRAVSPMKNSNDQIDLFLADADEQRPVLADGLPAKAALGAPRPRAQKVKELRRIEKDWNDLALQEWTIIAPEGREGDRQLEAIEPLRRLRAEEQGAPVKVHRVPPDMSTKDAADWKLNVFWPEGTPEEDVPLYALVLGDLHQTSAELQHVLATNTLVGRLHVATPEGETDLSGYAAYAEKVARLARDGTPETKADFLFYTAPDGSSATVAGQARLVAPSFEASLERLASGKLPAAAVSLLEADTVEALLAAAGVSRPSVLLSVSHGQGAPRRGWKSEEERWRQQGAMVIDHGEVMDAERLRGQPFLPGGMWFFLACFGAGTPAASAYKAWLSKLSEGGAYGGNPAAVEKSLPAPGQRPFMAALPQAALANPQGPLAVIGHLDLAWTYGFSGTRDLTESRKSRILSPLEKLVEGSRAGVALGKLMTEYAEINDDLMREYQLEKDAGLDHRASDVDPTAQAHRWMLRNDLRGYVLLGDPAARLPLAQNALRPAARAGGERALEVLAAAAQKEPVQVASAPPTAPAGSGPTASVPAPEGAPAAWAPASFGGPTASPEAAVLAMIRGDEAPRAIALRAGVSMETLWSWLDQYRAGGRARLPG